MKRGSFLAVLQTYAYAGIISSGPWVLLIVAVLMGIYDIIKIQALAAIAVFLVGAKLLDMAGIPQVYLPLLYI